MNTLRSLHLSQMPAVKVVVTLTDENGRPFTDTSGQLLFTQPLQEYLYDKSSPELILLQRGRELGRILLEETGSIRFKDNQWFLSEFLSLDPQRNAIKLLGKIAEAVIVRACVENVETNCRFLQIARRASKQKPKTAEKFHAIGTGLKSTDVRFHQHYSPSDPQRDIIWIYRENPNEVALMAGASDYSAVPAGLQVKVSQDGTKYVLPDLLRRRYIVPIMYFPLSGDYAQVIRKFYERQQNWPSEKRRDLKETDFVDVSLLDRSVFDEVKNYLPLVDALIRGTLKPKDIVSATSQDRLLQSAVMTVGLQNTAVALPEGVLPDGAALLWPNHITAAQPFIA